VLSSSSASRSEGLDDSRPCSRVDEDERAGCLATTAARLDLRGGRGPSGLAGEPSDEADEWVRACCEVCCGGGTNGPSFAAMSSRSSGGSTVLVGAEGAETGPSSVSVQPRWEPSPDMPRARRLPLRIDESPSLSPPALENDSGRPSPLDLGERGRPRGPPPPLDKSADMRLMGEGLAVVVLCATRSLMPASCVLGVVLRKVVRIGPGGLSGVGDCWCCSWPDRRREPPIGIRPDVSLSLALGAKCGGGEVARSVIAGDRLASGDSVAQAGRAAVGVEFRAEAAEGLLLGGRAEEDKSSGLEPDDGDRVWDREGGVSAGGVASDAARRSCRDRP
jgi:hypothetical protein